MIGLRDQKSISVLRHLSPGPGLCHRTDTATPERHLFHFLTKCCVIAHDTLMAAGRPSAFPMPFTLP